MELGPLAPSPRSRASRTSAVTCDGTVWADCGQGMQEVCLLRRCFPSAQSIREFAVRLCSQLGRRLDDACPIADASTVDGLRVHAVIAPLVPQGAAISHTIARCGLARSGIVGAQRHVSSRMAAPAGRTGVPQGKRAGDRRTGAGKTTMLKAMLMRCPPNERIVTVEEVRELGMIQHANHVSLVTREANTEGAGGIGLSELICATLRMRPDRVVVGECRGGEVVDLLRALNSGHRGGMTTLHANQVEAVPRDWSHWVCWPDWSHAPRRRSPRMRSTWCFMWNVSPADGALRRSADWKRWKGDCMGVCWPPGMAVRSVPANVGMDS